MNNIRMMAVRINHETYSLAVACLPPVFATIPYNQVRDHYLVINELSAWDGRSKKQRLTISNGWCTERMFRERYQFIDDEVPNQFTEVVSIS